MRAAVKTEGTAITRILTHFVHCNPFTRGNVENERLAQQSLLRFTGILVQEFKVSRLVVTSKSGGRLTPHYLLQCSFSEHMLRLQRKLCGDLALALKPAICAAAASQAPVADFLATGYAIEAWQVLLSLKRWLLLG